MMYLASLEEGMKDKVKGYNFVHTKEELDRVVADNTVANTILIRGDFSAKFFTPSGLVNYVNNAMTLNRNLSIEIDKKSDVVDYDRIICKLQNCRNIEEIMHVMVSYEKEFLDVIRELINARAVNRKTMLEFSNQVSRLQSVVNDYKSEVEDLKIALGQEQENKLQYQARLFALINRINYQYDAKVDKNKLFVVKGNEYDRILYFKEVSRVQYTDSFIYYLKELLKVLYGMPTRLVVVESYYATGKVKQYPNLKPHHNLVEEDVLSGDILMLGLQPNLMSDILKNPSRISVLIVLDRAGYESPHILGDNVEYFYMASDIKDVPDDVPKTRIISYQEDTLFIKYIKDFEKMDHAKRISEYSSSKLVRSIINLIER